MVNHVTLFIHSKPSFSVDNHQDRQVLFQLLLLEKKYHKRMEIQCIASSSICPGLLTTAISLYLLI